MDSTPSSWLDQLQRDGFVVIPNVIPEEACDRFQDAALSWLEGFPHGFKRDDRSTWDAEHLPYAATGGLYNRYGVNHEAFVWAIREQLGISKLYAEMYGTDDLIVSFDGANITLPIGSHGRRDIQPTVAWPHIDQSCHDIAACQLFQGIAVLSSSGPRDGGLVVMKGSHKLHQKYREEERFLVDGQARHVRGYSYNVSDLDWYNAHGAEEVKVCGGKGDFILWDSRTIHWNASPVGDKIRFATYVALTPRNLMSDEDLEQKFLVFKERQGTTGYPYVNDIPEKRSDSTVPRRPDGSIDLANRVRPVGDVKETPRVLSLVGVR